MSPNSVESLSRFLSYVLRHAPREFGLVLDQDGYVSLDTLVAAIRTRPKWRRLNKEDILDLVATSRRKRFEVKDQRIRALYGHTAMRITSYSQVTPPTYLFHGTARRNSRSIERLGLVPRSRAFVHLSQSIDDALIVERRRDRYPVVYKVLALCAHHEGIRFFRAGDVYLCPFVPPRYLLRLRL
jgi:putative RNA 2'-phosphotransferase